MKEPLYKKILDDLKKQIFSGNLPLNSQLPTEKELSEIYKVSRITSKRALSELERLDLIYRVRGKGSFVKEVPSPNIKKDATKTSRILFLLPFLHDLSLGNFTDGLLPVMQKHQMEVVMGTLEVFTQKQPHELMEEYDGLIYYAEDTDQYLSSLVELSLKGHPVISLDKKNYELNFPTILSDNFAGGQLATQFLMDNGHTRIAYLYNHSHLPQSVRNRYIGYLTTLHRADLTDYTAAIDVKNEDGALLRYIKEHQVTGFICENDLIAMEAMRSLKHADYTIPEDLSIIGFDNIQASSFVDPPLTTVAQDFKKIGQIAGQTLIEWIENDQMPSDIKVPVTFIKRESTKNVKQ
ncbi:GntR family transcriptional regulator [Gracilibacillus timonensis]|uniref:GntR family transcriptional regulator n=1 Tax=Gracilibacillus timonensis TaxID=1816696 RepID=UPI000824958C|nr:substrate-binding domain-containing protein [Gracilibacillus timonensis]